MWQKYKTTVWFLIRFFGVYVILSMAYSAYLDQYYPEIDPISDEVSKQVVFVMHYFVDDVEAVYSDLDPWTSIYCSAVPIMRIVEGCNAISVFILFLAFVVAFKSDLRSYLFFIPFGAAVLHISNVFRIALIGYIGVEQPDLMNVAHDYVFPAIIYGTVVSLWIVWVRVFAK